jgi:hypothetical protein
MNAIRLPAVVPVSGVSFRQAELRDVIEGDVLDVVAVEDNPHDAAAVEVRTAAGVLVGFVPRALAGRLRASSHGPWQAKVREVLRGETWGLRIEIHPAGVSLVAGRDRIASEAAPQPVKPNAQVVVAEPESPRAEAPDEVVERRHVIAPSGRVLGEYVRTEGTRVIARSRGGEVSFPAHTVVLRPAS